MLPPGMRKLWQSFVSPERLLLTYTGHTEEVNSVAWSPEGQRSASGSEDKTVQVWNAADGRPFLTYRGHTDQVQAVAWSPDGQRLASASYDDTVQVSF